MSKSTKMIIFGQKQLVLAESASYIAGATVNENSPKPDGSGSFTKEDFVLYGSIHMQMRNDMNMRKKLEGVFDANLGKWEKAFIMGIMVVTSK